MSSSRHPQVKPEWQSFFKNPTSVGRGHTIGVGHSPFSLPPPITGTCHCGSSHDRGNEVPVLPQQFRVAQVSRQEPPHNNSNHPGEPMRRRLQHPIRHNELSFMPQICISMGDDAIRVQFYISGVKKAFSVNWVRDTQTLCIKGASRLPGPGELGSNIVYVEGMFGEFERHVSLHEYLGTVVVDYEKSKIVPNASGILVILPKVNKERGWTSIDAIEAFDIKLGE